MDKRSLTFFKHPPMVEIIPAIMPKSFADLREKMSSVAGFVSLAQIDVMDGVFVPDKSWPYITKPDPDFERILKEDTAFPHWRELDFEADLMVATPETAALDWIAAGAKRLIVHLESMNDPKSILEKIKKTLPSEGSFLRAEIGIAVNPGTPNERLEPAIELADFVQFMGIAKIGFQGQAFDERVLDKISGLRAVHPNVTISVDGGVDFETAPKLIKVGATRLAIGSAIFESGNIAATIEEFLGLSENI